jgi:site-specific recombinase XerC
MNFDPIKTKPAWHGVNRFGERFAVLDPHKQCTVILDVYGLDNQRRQKTNAFTTKKSRAYLVHSFVEQLREEGFKIKTILNLDDRHVAALIARWREEELAVATIKVRLSCMRWFTNAIGKPGLVRQPEFYGIDSSELVRSVVATTDKSWTAKGIFPVEKIDQVKQFDDWAGTQLELMYCFGLRIQEALLMKPRASHIQDTLRVEDGTKGGRTRVVPIRTDKQCAVLERAKEMSIKTSKGSMVQPGKTPEQARNRIYYLCKKFGITKAELDITPHGLRHEYANDRYEEISGTKSTARGGSEILSPAKELEALHAVTSDMGHARLRITSAYTGPRKRLGPSSEPGPTPPQKPPLAPTQALSQPGGEVDF